MGYCSHCGNELADGARFCSSCGHSQQPSAPIPQRNRTSSGNRLHCPNCHSNAISPVVETEISGGMAMNHSITRRNSVSGFSLNNTHRNYWMCSDCGTKFRNLQNLEEELASLRKAVKSAIGAIVLFALLGILSINTLGFGVTLLFLVPVIALIIAGILIVKGRIEKMEKERIYLKRNCFG